MLIFPQLNSGATVQYPVLKTVSQRSLQSTMADGTTISLADTSAYYLRWRIVFQNLSDVEAQALETFFASAQGNLRPFLFLDPTANLLLWSEDFTKPAWQVNGITFDAGIPDALGGTNATRAHNETAAAIGIAQQTQIPGSVQICFSVFLRSDNPSTASLTLSTGSGLQSLSLPVTPAWQRFHVSGAFSASSALLTVSITLPPGAIVDIFGPQLDAQVSPSTYVKSTGWSGVCANARFDMSQIDRIATGPNRNTCVVVVRTNTPGGA